MIKKHKLVSRWFSYHLRIILNSLKIFGLFLKEYVISDWFIHRVKLKYNILITIKNNIFCFTNVAGKFRCKSEGWVPSVFHMSIAILKRHFINLSQRENLVRRMMVISFHDDNRTYCDGPWSHGLSQPLSSLVAGYLLCQSFEIVFFLL